MGATMSRWCRAFLVSKAGFLWAVRNERAFQEELIALGFAVPMSFWITDAPWKRSALIASVLLVILIETVNSAIEKLADHVSPEHNNAIKIVKDLGSLAVLIAIAIAGLFWIPAILSLFA